MPRPGLNTERESPEFVPESHDRGYFVPSVEFTFSCGSPSSGRSTPTSSQDETFDSSPDEPDRQSTVPITRPPFESLRLDDSMERDVGQTNRTATDNANITVGSGIDRRRKQAMYDHLSGSSMFTDYASKIKADYRGMTQEVFFLLKQGIQAEVANMTRDMRVSVVIEGEVTEADRSPALTDRLGNGVIGLQDYLLGAQTAVRQARQEIAV